MNTSKGKTKKKEENKRKNLLFFLDLKLLFIFIEKQFSLAYKPTNNDYQ